MTLKQHALLLEIMKGLFIECESGHMVCARHRIVVIVDFQRLTDRLSVDDEVDHLAPVVIPELQV